MNMGCRLKHGLRKAAGDILLKYQSRLGCIPLTIADMKPAGSRHGAIVGDTPYVHFLATFRCIGFAPARNHWLLGRVSDEQPWPKGMNINVLRLVNIMVQQESLPRELHYSRPDRAWMNSAAEEGKQKLGDKNLVLLRVTKIDCDVIRQGDIGIELKGLVETTGHIREKGREKKHKSWVPDPDAGPFVLTSELTPRKKKLVEETPPPSTKRKREREEEGAASTAASSSAVNGHAEAAQNGKADGVEDSAHKKKKKDKKDKDEEIP